MKTMTRILCLLALGAAAVSCADASPQGPTAVAAEAIVIDFPPGPNAYHIVPSMELMITDSNDVVDNPSYTVDPCSGAGSAANPWTFQTLMTSIANHYGVTGTADVAYMVQNMMNQWMADQTVTLPGGGTELVPNRATMMQQEILGPWPTIANPGYASYLDLSKAPFRLLAIVNRMDLRTSDGLTQAGQGRFVFGAVYHDGTACVALPFTMIFEYDLPTAVQGAQAWAEQWHQLGSYYTEGFTSSYLTSLLDLTNSFTQGSNLSLSAIRTDEIALAPVQGIAEPGGIAPVGSWDLREIHPVQSGCPTVPDQPSLAACLLFSQTTNNADYALLAQQNTLYGLMTSYACTPSSASPVASNQGAYAPNFPTLWNATSSAGTPASASQRHEFAINSTCQGCHNFETGNQAFMHILPRNAGTASQLSNFLTGCSGSTLSTADCEGDNYTAYDPVNTQASGSEQVPIPYPFNELDRRSENLWNLVNGGTTYYNCL